MNVNEMIKSVADAFARERVSIVKRIREGGDVVLDLSMTTISGVKREIGRIELPSVALAKLTVRELADQVYAEVAPVQRADFEMALSRGLVQTNYLHDTSFLMDYRS